jgi:hypothetical protein
MYELVESLRDPNQIECAFAEGASNYSGGQHHEMVAQRFNPFPNREIALYERFLDTMARHSQDLEGK